MNTEVLSTINEETLVLAAPQVIDKSVSVTEPIVIYNQAAKCHRNEPCRCGSGKKYKRCCMRKHRTGERAHYYH